MFQSNFNVDSLGQAVTNICAHTKLHIYVYHRKLNGNFIKESCRDLCLFFSLGSTVLVLCGYAFFHPHHNGQWPPTSKDFHLRCYPFTFCLILNSWERGSISHLMLIAKQGNYWYHIYICIWYYADLLLSKPALYQ